MTIFRDVVDSNPEKYADMAQSLRTAAERLWFCSSRETVDNKTISYDNWHIFIYERAGIDARVWIIAKGYSQF